VNVELQKIMYFDSYASKLNSLKFKNIILKKIHPFSTILGISFNFETK
jgi:hypothetical protein